MKFDWKSMAVSAGFIVLVIGVANTLVRRNVPLLGTAVNKVMTGL